MTVLDVGNAALEVLRGGDATNGKREACEEDVFHGV
jgi:hypothetical protein